MPNEKDPPVSINLGNIANGAMVELFEEELPKILANINDTNTKATAKRTMTLTIEFQPDADRIVTSPTIGITLALAKRQKVTNARMFIGKGEDGKLYALTADPRQMHIFTPAAPKEVPKPLEFTRSS